MADDKVSVTLDRDVFEELQELSTPLVDDINSVLRRLLASVPRQPEGAARVTTLARGSELPVGLRLRGYYWGRTFEAVVTERGIEFAGEVYDSPSAAAKAAKRQAGATGGALQANGWRFWRYIDEETGAIRPLVLLRYDADNPPPKPKSLGIGNSGYTDTARLAGEIGLGPLP